MKRVLILYTELAGYVVNCINKLAEECNVDVIAYPVNKEAPFQFQLHTNTSLHNRNDFDSATIQQLIDQNNYDFIFCAGWSDKSYVEIIKRNQAVPNCLDFDNQWHGNLRQRLAVVYARLFLVPKFRFAFVAGQPQKVFARKMGFKEQQVKLGLYACELEKFNVFFDAQKPRKRETMPTKLLYVGRYISQKGIDDLFEVFLDLKNEDAFKGWELHCLGTGDLWDQRPIHPSIVHHGFVQPSDFAEHLANTSIFVLPSHFEPWGVVVQEMAAAGFPMVVSDRIGAASAFLQEGKNGFKYQAGNKGALKRALKNAMSLNESSYAQMADKSHALAQTVSPEAWASTILEMMDA